MRFDPLKDNFSLPGAEEKILAFWDERRIFDHVNKAVADRPHFVFYEGPPTANGKPGIHHVISRTVKDLICRYKTMSGYRVDRKAGWDTHGLPVEIEVEKALGLDSKQKVVEYGIIEFNRKCRESVFKYLEDWNSITRRIGYWLDLDDAYVTLTDNYIESVWHILKFLHDKGLIYKGHKTVPYCPRCGTALSSHEVAQGYEMVQDPSVFVKVKAADGDFSYLVWTTTPWTLPSNAALAMQADADYVLVEHDGEKMVLAEALLGQVFDEQPRILEKYKGSEFVSRKYEPLFDTFADYRDRAFFVINADFVTLDDGTGIVHIAPGFGADDYEAGKLHDLPILQAIEPNGIFKPHSGKYAGMWIKDADKEITKDLKADGRLFKKEQYEHNYPFCWRCDSPLIYIARESWYIKTTDFRDRLLENNNSINWHPDEIRSGRMANWLENNVDWALSRERFWGTPLPIWICDDPACGKQRAIGSLEELRKHALTPGAEIDAALKELGLHRPGIDAIKLTCECGGGMTRVPELIDVWFDSGAMPFAQWHYPFENIDEFQRKFPADFISEAVDQTRGWFYSLLAISTMFKGIAPFKNVIVLEFILDKVGKKMSKHKGNVVNPFETVDQYGADPLRWYLVSTSNPWLPTKFDFEGLSEVVRKYFDTLRNTYSFFAIYANIDDTAGRAAAADKTVDAFLESLSGEPSRFDRWIVSRYNTTVTEVTRSLDKYDITRAVREIQEFVIEDLSNWYVRNNRRRYWADGDDPSKMRAYLTLYRMLEGVCRLSAPIAPFISELLWGELAGADRERHGLPLTVHLCDYPKPIGTEIDDVLEDTMETVRRMVSMGRAARARHNLKVRQPLSTLLVSLHGKSDLDQLLEYLPIVRDELNVKQIIQSDEVDSYVTYSAKLNFKAAGPKLGGKVKSVAPLVQKLASEAVRAFARTGELVLSVDGERVALTPEEVDVTRVERAGYAVETDNALTIALVTELTDELRDEGFAREMVNKIQNMRKSSGLEVTDRITVALRPSERLRTAISRHEEFIRRETLAERIDYGLADTHDGAKTWNINGEEAVIAVTKA
ncbi:MAG: isoleucine--tRNA ligase [candidate division Zixibacteria bacterium]|jgi:isoleucyl-tRNA synthetase|nr:isoleucine--tRNA ligase [candidate division Zixibacteria bacterium]